MSPRAPGLADERARLALGLEEAQTNAEREPIVRRLAAIEVEIAAKRVALERSEAAAFERPQLQRLADEDADRRHRADVRDAIIALSSTAPSFTSRHEVSPVCGGVRSGRYRCQGGRGRHRSRGLPTRGRNVMVAVTAATGRQRIAVTSTKTTHGAPGSKEGLKR